MEFVNTTWMITLTIYKDYKRHKHECAGKSECHRVESLGANLFRHLAGSETQDRPKGKTTWTNVHGAVDTGRIAVQV